MKRGGADTMTRVLIVAEIGNNHEGRLDIAEQMIAEASSAGVDAVKFQTFRTEHYVSKSDPARFARLQSFELSPEQFRRLAGLAHELGLLFISTPFDLPSVSVLVPLVDAFKISSGDNTFFPLIASVAATGKPIIVSSGLLGLAELSETVRFIQTSWKQRAIAGDLTVLHCVTSYPVPPDEANLRSIPHIATSLQVAVGYSDHTIGNDAAVLAVALGARLIEKHFTLDKGFSDFRDHQLSADPADLRELVLRIRQAEELLGVPEKRSTASEDRIASAVRRSIVSGGAFARGRRLSMDDLTWTRPGGGLAPGQEHQLVGRVLKRNVVFGEPLGIEDVE